MSTQLKLLYVSTTRAAVNLMGSNSESQVCDVSLSSCSLLQWISQINCPSARDRGTNQCRQLLLLCVLSMNTCSVVVCQLVHKLPS